MLQLNTLFDQFLEHCYRSMIKMIQLNFTKAFMFLMLVVTLERLPSVLSHDCHYSLNQAWLSEAGTAPIVSSPLIVDVNGDNIKDVAVATFDGQVSVIDGSTGLCLSGWPITIAGSNFHAAPLMYDIDKDGLMEMVVTTSDSKVVFIDMDGHLLYGRTLQVPCLKLKKKWFTITLDDLQQRRANPTLYNPRDDAQLCDTREFLDKNSPTQGDPLWSQRHPGRCPSGVSTDGVWVYVDPHVLSTPVITDFNNDGHENELVAAVNFYFGHERMSFTPPLTALSEEEAENYLGCGLVVFDLDSGKIIFHSILEVTKRSSPYPGYCLSSPTIVDNTSVVIGTSTGNLFLVSSRKSQPETLTSMDSLQGQVTVADVNDDGAVELVSIDDSGNVACTDLSGKMVWEGRVSGSAAAGIRVADINGDGPLEVVFATYDGYIWALSGDQGKVVPGWPVKMPDELRAAVLITKLHPGESSGLDIVVPLLDGTLAIIRGTDRCTEIIRTGVDSLASAVTADLLPWKPGMELIVGGTDGTLLCLGYPGNTTKDGGGGGIGVRTDLFSWAAATAPCTGTTFYSGKVGVSLTKATRLLTQFSGSSYPLEFEIIDIQPNDLRWNNYKTKVLFGNRQVALNKTFDAPGVYMENLVLPSEPLRAVLTIRVTTPNNQCFEDSFHVSLNTHYLEDIHWYLLTPFLTMACLLLVLIGNAPGSDILPTITKKK
ncbi:protein DEFECTIVE IN EXINE FORMATION 1 [Nematostella vectensis]|uniref:protein DEFECTIVE IN EXINE FORMATION 1 n=1 Tax=Nematostella vectensis TaxID=45351 RepID=UPI002076E4A1|nr:protein DEFECTIVE IN EXINE FORMATION 1 [Nematostella vectensis]